MRFSGERMLVHVHRPSGGRRKRFPAVLFLHGFPGLEKSIDVQRALMSRGIASIAPSFLGCWGSGGEYRFSTLIAQARAVYRAMRRMAFVDGGRVGVFGFSMGGWAALNLAALEPNIKAVVAVAPAGGPEMVRANTQGVLARLARPLRAICPKTLAADFRRAVTERDAAAAAAKIKAPTLLVHGDADTTIPVFVSRRIASRGGRRLRLRIERGAEHDFLDRRDALTRVCSGFLGRHLLAASLAAAVSWPVSARAQAYSLSQAAFEATVSAGMAEAVFVAQSGRPAVLPDVKTPAQVRRGVEGHLNGRVPKEFVAAFFSHSSLKIIDGVAEMFLPSDEGRAVTYEEYRARFINPAGLAAGAAFMSEYGVTLASVSARMSMDPCLLAALVGVETRFGAVPGRMPIGASLWTIARKVPPRPERGETEPVLSNWAVREIAELLLFTYTEGERDGGAVHLLRGSYAGAFGLSQFLPSSANKFAVDFDGDGKRRLNEWPDALASAANYLTRNGFLGHEPYTRESAIGRSIFAYNRSGFYVRVVMEFRDALLKAPVQRPETARRDLMNLTKSSLYSR